MRSAELTSVCVLCLGRGMVFLHLKFHMSMAYHTHGLGLHRGTENLVISHEWSLRDLQQTRDDCHYLGWLVILCVCKVSICICGVSAQHPRVCTAGHFWAKLSWICHLMTWSRFVYVFVPLVTFRASDRPVRRSKRFSWKIFINLSGLPGCIGFFSAFNLCFPNLFI